MDDPVFEVEHLSLAYPGRRGQPVTPILKDIPFTVERGRALTLVGPSGSGKSSSVVNGMMTGQILAGSSPLLAIRYQIVVVFMPAAATALATLVFVRLIGSKYRTSAHQLRRYLLERRPLATRLLQ
jgi:energy-coupling factor transporter ATP-binding protein EcfA2